MSKPDIADTRENVSQSEHKNYFPKMTVKMNSMQFFSRGDLKVSPINILVIRIYLHKSCILLFLRFFFLRFVGASKRSQSNQNHVYRKNYIKIHFLRKSSTLATLELSFLGRQDGSCREYGSCGLYY